MGLARTERTEGHKISYRETKGHFAKKSTIGLNILISLQLGYRSFINT